MEQVLLQFGVQSVEHVLKRYFGPKRIMFRSPRRESDMEKTIKWTRDKTRKGGNGSGTVPWISAKIHKQIMLIIAWNKRKMVGRVNSCHVAIVFFASRKKMKHELARLENFRRRFVMVSAPWLQRPKQKGLLSTVTKALKGGKDQQFFCPAWVLWVAITWFSQ